MSIQVGRITGGALCDRSWAPRPLSLMMITSAVALLPNLALAIFTEYWSFVLNFGLVCLVFGVFGGCTNPVLMEMLGLGSLSVAFSWVSAFRGVSCIVGNYTDKPSSKHLTDCSPLQVRPWPG